MDLPRRNPAALFREFLAAVERGEDPDFDEFYPRHPEDADSLHGLLRRMLDPAKGSGHATAPSIRPSPEEPGTTTWDAFLDQLRSRGPVHTR